MPNCCNFSNSIYLVYEVVGSLNRYSTNPKLQVVTAYLILFAKTIILDNFYIKIVNSNAYGFESLLSVE